MKRRLLIGSVLAIVLCAIGAAIYLKLRNLPPEALLARLPSDNAAVLSIDFSALRQGGIFEMLSGPIVEEEPEYKTFVEKTAFDYRRDLDHAGKSPGRSALNRPTLCLLLFAGCSNRSGPEVPAARTPFHSSAPLVRATARCGTKVGEDQSASEGGLGQNARAARTWASPCAIPS
jgi:hypothetical protein